MGQSFHIWILLSLGSVSSTNRDRSSRELFEWISSRKTHDFMGSNTAVTCVKLEVYSSNNLERCPVGKQSKQQKPIICKQFSMQIHFFRL